MVAPLLQFKQEYYQNFIVPMHELHANLSGDGLETRWLMMLTQLDRAIAELRYMEEGVLANTEPVKLSTQSGTYVDRQRLHELSSAASGEFDLTRLVELLREINLCHQNRCYLAVAALTRAVLDHVPPVFGFTSFAEVASNYGGGGRSFKESMANLDKSARKIGDQHLHMQIRSKEALPTIKQIDFSNDIDVLLAEIVRILK